MAAKVPFIGRLVAVLVPTKAQALVCLVISLVLLVAAQAEQLLRLVGVNDIALDATSTQLHSRFDSILTSQIASSTALVTFWASVGLIAYLICWAAYNALIEARNEVTLETQYTNRGHWRGPIETLAVKAVGALVLIGVVALLNPGLALWLAMVMPLLAEISPMNVLAAGAASLGLAAQLYLIFALALVTITPWYSEEAFTDAA